LVKSQIQRRLKGLLEKKKRSIVSSSPRLSSAKYPSIKINLCGFDLDSPTMVASGILGISFDLFPRIIKSGAGAIVSKSIGLESREGYPNPTMTGTDSGYLNAIGLANPGVEVFSKELEEYKGRKIPLIVSIFADSSENFQKLASMLERHDFLALELNLSCPHVKEVGSEIGTDRDEAASIVRAVKQVTQKPIFAKMPASIPKVPEWAKTVESAGANAIVAINTIRAMKIEIESRKPVLSNKIGGLSGPAIRPVGVRCVYEIFESVKIPIIGVGGIVSSKDAIEYFLAGARAVQIGSAMGTRYLGTFREVNDGLRSYLKKQGFSKIEEIVGLAHN
jgi:dihydroorotate dehydrogenase (NAD+) catalytic subunit